MKSIALVAAAAAALATPAFAKNQPMFLVQSQCLSLPEYSEQLVVPQNPESMREDCHQSYLAYTFWYQQNTTYLVLYPTKEGYVEKLVVSTENKSESFKASGDGCGTAFRPEALAAIKRTVEAYRAKMSPLACPPPAQPQTEQK
jgi:hypothetical protein